MTGEPDSERTLMVPEKYWVAMVLLDWTITSRQFMHRQALLDTVTLEDEHERKTAGLVAENSLLAAFYHVRWRDNIVLETNLLLASTKDPRSLNLPLLNIWLWMMANGEHNRDHNTASNEREIKARHAGRSTLEDLAKELVKVLERLAALEAHLKAIENLVGDLYDNSETRATGYVTRLTAPINKLTARIEELENAPDVEADMEALSPRVLAAEQGVLAAERTLNETREHLNSVHAFFTAELTDIRKTISSGPEKHTVSDLHARLDGVEAEFRKYSRLSNIPPPIQATPLAPSPAVYRGPPAISAAAGSTAHCAESHRARSKRPAGEADGGSVPKRARQENAVAGPSTLPIADSPIVPLELVSAIRKNLGRQKNWQPAQPAQPHLVSCRRLATA
ncbi:hypothetical protein HWV62_21912 [Athelia sp. TMB]|nr:hypothetical protein HWV62_21912 [Athelia sp. TMB]